MYQHLIPGLGLDWIWPHFWPVHPPWIWWIRCLLVGWLWISNRQSQRLSNYNPPHMTTRPQGIRRRLSAKNGKKLPMTTRAKTPMSLMDIHLTIHRVHYASPVDLELKDHFKWCRPPKNDQSDCQPDIYIYYIYIIYIYYIYILSNISKIGYYSSWWICRWMDIYYQKCIVLSLLIHLQKCRCYRDVSRWWSDHPKTEWSTGG